MIGRFLSPEKGDRGSEIIWATGPRNPSPEDGSCRAQGGEPTKEGTKPWVEGAPLAIRVDYLGLRLHKI